MGHKKPSFIERMAEKLGLIPDLHKKETEAPVDRLIEEGEDLTRFPPMDQWDNWTEYEAKSWPKKEKKT
ncbi:MAG: hypothetical protein ACI956_002137, partial [Nonlabens sp.]